MLDLRQKLGVAGLTGLALFGTGYTAYNRIGPSVDVAAGGEFVVQVAGAVHRPGLVHCKAGSRINDAIENAGGATRDADVNRLNLAEPIVDGEKIRVPALGEVSDEPLVVMPKTAVPEGLLGKGGTSTSKSKGRSTRSGRKAPPAAGSISINAASAKDLEEVPGIGPSTAQRILDFRKQIGRFTSVEQLMDVKGIGPKKFEKMRAYFRL